MAQRRFNFPDGETHTWAYWRAIAAMLPDLQRCWTSAAAPAGAEASRERRPASPSSADTATNGAAEHITKGFGEAAALHRRANSLGSNHTSRANPSTSPLPWHGTRPAYHDQIGNTYLRQFFRPAAAGAHRRVGDLTS